MPNQFRVVEVIFKPTGEKRIIKLSRYNPELHKIISPDYAQEYAIHYNKPMHLQQDAVGMAQLEGQIKLEEKQAEEQTAKESTIIEEKAVEVPEEKPYDESVDLPIEEVEKLQMWQIRKYAKARGIEVTPKSTKKDLVAQVRSLNSN